MKESKLLDVHDPKTKEINPTAIKLALIGAMQEQCSFFQNSGDFEFHLQEAVIQDVYYRREDVDANPDRREAINDLLTDFLRAIEDKAKVLGFDIYENKGLGGKLHTDKLVDNFDTVLSEVAKDLCSASRVVIFRPTYEEGEWLWSKNHFFDSIVEIRAGGMDFLAGFFNTSLYSYGGVFNTYLHNSYCGVPDKYINHILLGCDEDVSRAKGSKLISPEKSVNSFIISALENLARNEVAKCITDYSYKQAAKTPAIEKEASQISEQLGISKKGLLIVASQAVNINRQDVFEDRQWLLEGVASRNYSHLLSKKDIAGVTNWLANLDDRIDFQADYSVNLTKDANEP